MSLVHRDRKQRRWQNSWIIETKRFIVWLQPTKDLLVGVGVSYSGSEYLGIHFHTQVASNDSRVSVGRTSVLNYSVWRVKWLAIPLDFPVSQLIWSHEHADKTRREQDRVRGQEHVMHQNPTCMDWDREQKTGRWDKMWCFIMEMALCGVLCWIITSRCLGSQGLADIKACRVLGKQWHGGEELGPPPAG